MSSVDLFGNEQDLSCLLDENLKKEWKMLGYEIEYQDFPRCLNVLEFSKDDEKYIHFIVDKSGDVDVNTFDDLCEWQYFTQSGIHLISKTIDFIKGVLR